MLTAIVVRKRDVERAGALLQRATAEAQDLSIPDIAITEALVEQLRRLALQSNELDGAAAYLRALAAEVEAISTPN